MKQTARTHGRWLGRICRHLNPCSDILKAGKHPRTSDIILSMMLVMLAIVLVAWLLTSLFGLK